MQLPNGSVLMHDRSPYDPKKAHEYYLRTRKLKGRKKGVTQPAPAGRVVAGSGQGSRPRSTLRSAI